ncbi:MAG: SAM-dependent methyltransferase [Proteobacteria bacterium]|nr:SAM-dependent methyltransferase [Pseudomonadota bacterium]MDE3207938.1 SAM-dependent methyltransferase [Pseudomonadota bacterium]
MNSIQLTDAEFQKISGLVMELSGIYLSESKKALVSGRLAKRLREFGLDSYNAYFDLLMEPGGQRELQHALDLLTTNETYFFREPDHFDYLRENLISQLPSHDSFRVWSAACSSGEEAYTLAMVLADSLGSRVWEIIASDLSSRMLDKARTGIYPESRKKHFPPFFFERFCQPVVKNPNEFEIDRKLKRRVHFMPINLISSYPDIGPFDLIFLRNVMIYFDLETKRNVVRKILGMLKKGGHFIIGHSENLHGIDEGLMSIKPSIFRKI